jgi:hypothetical protein
VKIFVPEDHIERYIRVVITNALRRALGATLHVKFKHPMQELFVSILFADKQLLVFVNDIQNILIVHLLPVIKCSLSPVNHRRARSQTNVDHESGSADPANEPMFIF